MGGKAAAHRAELERKLVPMGWEYAGHAKSGHLIWRHPRAGTIQTSGTPSDPRTLKNEISRARWQIKRIDGLAEEFLMWLRGRFNIERTGHADFIGWGRLPELIVQWDRERPGKPVNTASLITMLKRDSPFLQSLYSPDADRKRAVGFRVYGRDYLLPEVEDDPLLKLEAAEGHDRVKEPEAEIDLTHEEQTDGPQTFDSTITPGNVTYTNGTVPDTNELVDRILKAATGVLYQEEHEKREMLRDELRRIKIGQGQLMHQIREITTLATQIGEAVDEVLELDKIEQWTP